MFYESPREGGDVVDLEDVKGDWNETRDPSTHHGNAPKHLIEHVIDFDTRG